MYLLTVWFKTLLLICFSDKITVWRSCFQCQCMIFNINLLTFIVYLIFFVYAQTIMIDISYFSCLSLPFGWRVKHSYFLNMIICMLNVEPNKLFDIWKYCWIIWYVLISFTIKFFSFRYQNEIFTSSQYKVIYY